MVSEDREDAATVDSVIVEFYPDGLQFRGLLFCCQVECPFLIAIAVKEICDREELLLDCTCNQGTQEVCA